MIPSGIFVRADAQELAEQLIERLSHLGSVNLLPDKLEGTDLEDGKVCVELSGWSDRWSFLEITGAEKGPDILLEALVTHDPFEEILATHFMEGAQEYGYALYQQGKVMEQFDSRGPGVESIHFVSELRRVPLASLMSARVFMQSALQDHGVTRDDRTDKGDTVFMELTLPGKPTFLQSILGAASRR